MDNEIKMAIKYFKDAIKESSETISECSPNLQVELIKQEKHFELAIAALEQQPKETCEYCSGIKPIRTDGKKGFYVEIQGNILYVQYSKRNGFHDYGFIDADYCLKCGQKLEGWK